MLQKAEIGIDTSYDVGARVTHQVKRCNSFDDVSCIFRLGHTAGSSPVCVGPHAMIPPRVQAAKYSGEKSTMPPLPLSLRPGILVSWLAMVKMRGSTSSSTARRTRERRSEASIGEGRSWMAPAPTTWSLLPCCCCPVVAAGVPAGSAIAEIS